MKHRGSNTDFLLRRNAALIKAYLAADTEAADSPLCRDRWQRAVALPAERFWVSEERAVAVVRAMLRGDNPLTRVRNGYKRAMFEEIFRRVKAYVTLRPDQPIPDIVADIVNNPAPSFYMDPRSAAETVYLHIRNRKRKKRQ